MRKKWRRRKKSCREKPKKLHLAKLMGKQQARKRPRKKTTTENWPSKMMMMMRAKCSCFYCPLTKRHGKENTCFNGQNTFHHNYLIDNRSRSAQLSQPHTKKMKQSSANMMSILWQISLNFARFVIVDVRTNQIELHTNRTSLKFAKQQPNRAKIISNFLESNKIDFLTNSECRKSFDFNLFVSISIRARTSSESRRRTRCHLKRRNYGDHANVRMRSFIRLNTDFAHLFVAAIFFSA